MFCQLCFSFVDSIKDEAHTLSYASLLIVFSLVLKGQANLHLNMQSWGDSLRLTT